MEPNSLPTLAVVALLSCRPHACSSSDRASFGAGRDNASASVECRHKHLNAMFYEASFSFVVAFVVSTTLPSSRPLTNNTCESPENNMNSELSPRELFPAADRIHAKSTMFQMLDVVDMNVQFHGDDNSFVLSKSVAVAPDRSTSRNRIPSVISARRHRRAQDTTSCNYSDFCNNDISRQIEAMVNHVESDYANRRTKKNKSNVARKSLSKHVVARELQQVTSLESDQVTKNNIARGPVRDDVTITRANSCYIQDPLYKPNREPSHLLGYVFHENMDDDVPAMRSCDSMSLTSDHSFSTRSSSGTIGVSPMKLTRNVSAQRNTEWPIIE